MKDKIAFKGFVNGLWAALGCLYLAEDIIAPLIGKPNDFVAVLLVYTVLYLTLGLLSIKLNDYDWQYRMAKKEAEDVNKN